MEYSPNLIYLDEVCLLTFKYAECKYLIQDVNEKKTFFFSLPEVGSTNVLPYWFSSITGILMRYLIHTSQNVICPLYYFNYLTFILLGIADSTGKLNKWSR